MEKLEKKEINRKPWSSSDIKCHLRDQNGSKLWRCDFRRNMKWNNVLRKNHINNNSSKTHCYKKKPLFLIDVFIAITKQNRLLICYCYLYSLYMQYYTSPYYIEWLVYQTVTNLWGPPRGMGISLLHSFSNAFPSFTARLQCSNPGVCRFSLLPPITCNLPLHSWVAGAYLNIILSKFSAQNHDTKKLHTCFLMAENIQTREQQ